jgi:lysophospholipase L1-like esterase
MIHRRDFLRKGALCTGAAALSSQVAAATEEDSAANANGYSYRRPAFKKGSRLLFIGDSITDMKWGRNEKDRNHYLGHSYVYLIASRLGVDIPGAQLEFFNRGHSGNRITDLRSRWKKDAIDMKPDLLSVLIGVNDRKVKKGASFDAEKWAENYQHILASSRQANPDLRIVLLDPFVLKTGWWMNKGGEWDASRAQIEQMRGVITKLAKEFSAVQVPTQDVFDKAAGAVGPAHWIWDGVHPLPQGHELIARRWLEDVSARWK